MRPSLSLFHCDTPGGNRIYEDRFERFVVSRDKENRVQRIGQSELEEFLTRAKEESPDNSAALSLAELLGTSLERDAYELFVEEVGPLVTFIYYDNFEVQDNGVGTDFEKTKHANYRKYCLFKFASFLDLLSPGSVHWRGQAELESDRALCAALDSFQQAGLQDRALRLSLIIHIPSQAEDQLSIFNPRYRRCAICGSREDLQEHHLGGEKHAPYFTIPLCALHHLPVTIAIKRAGVDMSHTDDETERLRRIVMACSILQWYSCEELQRQHKINSHEEQTK